MSLLRADLWWVGPLVVLAVVAARLAFGRRAVAFTRVALLDAPRYRASRLRHLPAFATALALGLVVVALLDPVFPYAERRVEARGLDIVLVIDLSLSMYEPIGLKRPEPGEGMPVFADTPKGSARIDAIKDALRGFIARRHDDRIGLVVFSDNAYVVSPLTFDRGHLLGYFDLIDPNTLFGEGMTAIGEGLAKARALLLRQSTSGVRNKVVLVFTDGASNVGRDPADVLEDTSASGIRVHVVGVDLQEEQKRSPQVLRFVSAIRRHGGRYYAADTRAQLEEASRALDELEKGFLTTKTIVRNEPAVAWFAEPTLALLLAAVGLRVLPIFVPLH